MIFNVSTLLGEPVGASRDHALADAPAESAARPRPIRGAARLTRTTSGILVSARLTLETDLACARCLTRFRRPHEIAFDEEFVPEHDPATGLPPAVDDPDTFRIDARQHLAEHRIQAVRLLGDSDDDFFFGFRPRIARLIAPAPGCESDNQDG